MRSVIFKQLYMENFRCHKEMSFDFVPNRFCVITGPNGVGKTSLIEGFLYCLYDETTKGRKGDDVIRKRSGKNTMVSLSFSIDDDEYIVENYRKHDKYGDEKILKKNGANISGINRKETNKRIEDILMPKDIFMNCLLFSQYINKPFTEMTDTGQKDIFDRMMGFLKYNEYSENCKTLIKECVSEIKKNEESLLVLSPNIYRNKDFLETEKKTKEESINSYYESKFQLEKLIKSLTEENEDLIPSVADIDEYRESKDKLQAIGTDSNSKIELINEEIDAKRDMLTKSIKSDRDEKTSKVIEPLKETLQEHKLNLSEIESDFECLKHQINTKNEELKSSYLEKKDRIEKPVQKDLDTLQRRLSVIKTELDGNHDLRDKSNDNLEEYEAKIADISAKLSTDNPICYACKQEIKDASLKEIEAILETDKKRKDECISDIKTLETREKELLKHKASYGKEIDKLEKKLINELAKLEEWKNEELGKLKEYKDEKLGDINKRKSLLEPEIKKLEESIRINSSNIEKEYDKILENKLEELNNSFNSKIEVLRNKKKTADIMVAELQSKILKMINIQEKINYNKGTIKSKSSELENIKKTFDINMKSYDDRISKLSKIIEEEEKNKLKLENEITRLNRRGKILEFWKKAFSSKGIKAILLDESIPILNRKSKELSSKTDCIRVKFDSQKALKSGEMRNQFTVLPIQTRNLTDNRSDFSQGEGRMVDIITLLSLRYLLEVTYDIKFNISLFDEILDSLYQDNAEIVIDFLQDISRECCTILITHTLRNNIEPDEHLEMGR